MEKTIIIGDVSIPMKTTAAVAIRYKMQFGTDYFADLLKMAKVLQPSIDDQEKRKEELMLNNISELKNIAAEKNLTGYSNFNKGNLIKLIIESEFDDSEAFALEKISFEYLNQLDTLVIYNFIWVLAKTANPTIPDPMEWLDSLDSLPLAEVLPEIVELLNDSIRSKKKKKMN